MEVSDKSLAEVSLERLVMDARKKMTLRQST